MTFIALLVLCVVVESAGKNIAAAIRCKNGQ